MSAQGAGSQDNCLQLGFLAIPLSNVDCLVYDCQMADPNQLHIFYHPGWPSDLPIKQGCCGLFIPSTSPCPHPPTNNKNSSTQNFQPDCCCFGVSPYEPIHLETLIQEILRLILDTNIIIHSSNNCFQKCSILYSWGGGVISQCNPNPLLGQCKSLVLAWSEAISATWGGGTVRLVHRCVLASLHHLRTGASCNGCSWPLQGF